MASAPTAGSPLTPADTPAAAGALERAHSLLLAALEATADGILVVDLEGRTVAHNTRFLEMWGIPPETIARGDDEVLRRFVAEGLEDPAGFGARVEALYADPEARGADTIRLRDGRTIERFSHPQRLDGNVVGRVWSFRDATDRVTAQEELRSRERQLAETQRLARLGSWRWDVPENRVTWSDELYRIYGLEPDAFGATFQAYLERVHPDDVDEVRARLERGLAEGGRLEFEERIVRPGGEVRVLRSVCEVMLDDEGRPLRVVGACHDITGQRRAELALQEANEALEARVAARTAELAETNLALEEEIAERARAEEELLRTTSELQAVFQALPDGYFRLDAAGTVLDHRPGALDTGLPEGTSIAGCAIDDVCPPEAARELHRALETVRRTGELVCVEYRQEGEDGGRDLEARVVPFRDGQAIAIVRDVTESRESARELQRSEAYFRSLIENGSDLITVVDAEGKTAYLSPSAERLLGWPPEERLGRSSFEMIHPDDAPAAVAARQEAVDNPGRAVQVEFRYRRRNGEWCVFEALVRTLLPDSAEGGLVVTARDVTERRMGQDALARAKEEAEHAREAAERANRAKSEFLSRMSHELRTPMNSILGFAQLLARRTDDETLARPVDHILKAGRHLLNLINEVLDIARIEANRHHLSLEPVRVDVAVTEAVNLMRPLAAQHGCRLEEPGPLPEGYVMADRQRLAQVLLNLLSNAIKYNRPEGRVWVTVDAAGGTDGGTAPAEWRMGVHDTGPGIPGERMEELFVPFSRLGADASDVEGTGLGLALSRRLAEAMGGRLEVESTVGRGSTFTVVLQGAESPLDRSRVRPADPAEHPAPGGARPATLLYVEDNLANLTLVEAILAARPEITLLPALQGRLGLELAAQHRPDLILLDLHLPDIPGDEVLARLRENPATRRIPVVVISADATPRRIERLREEGALAYLTKPIDVDEFMDTVDAVLQRREG